MILVLSVASLVAFGRIAGNDFINFDDNLYITENSHVQSGFNQQSIKWAFTTVHHSYWHPVTWLSHMLDWTLFGDNAGGHHVMSLLFHIGAVILLFLFLFKTTNNLWPSAFAAEKAPFYGIQEFLKTGGGDILKNITLIFSQG